MPVTVTVQASKWSEMERSKFQQRAYDLDSDYDGPSTSRRLEVKTLDSNSYLNRDCSVGLQVQTVQWATDSQRARLQ